MIDTKNKTISRKTEREYRPSYAVTHVPVARANAAKATKWEGRRYLGRTTTGGDVWINFLIERDSTKPSANVTLKIWSSASLDRLREDGAKLADCRVSFGTGKPMDRGLESYLNDRNNTHGKVTERTLDYLEEVIGKCSLTNPRRSQFWAVANLIFVGTYDDCKTFTKRFTLTELLREWNIKENYSL